MDEKTISRIFDETAFIRTGGSDEELRCAEYLVDQCRKFGCEARIEPFEVDMADILSVSLTADGESIPCRGYKNSGCADIEAPLYYLTDSSPYSLSKCQGKIILFDGYLGYWRYQDLVKYGAVGFISYDGHVNYTDRDMDQRELRAMALEGAEGKKLPGVHVNVKDAVKLIRDGVKTVKIHLEQKEYKGQSRNVVLDLPGELPQYIVLSAHYDSTPLSQGAYDNMSGSIGILAMAEYFASHAHRFGIRILWCGSEERGLLGSKAYCAAHREELDQVVLNINLDMVGSIMGKFIACCTTEEQLVHYIQYFSSEVGFACTPRQGVYSSDSTPFADAGVPAMSFARDAAGNCGTIHNSYDTKALMSMGQMAEDIRFMTAFTERLANAVFFPVGREIPENMKEKLDEYLARKRPKV